MVRARRVGRGLAGLVGLVTAVVGVPIGLTTVGEGPALHLPGLQAIRDGLGRPLTDSILLRTASVLCWVVWLLFVVAVAIEAIAQLGARAGRVRVAVRVPGLQGPANALLMTALLLLPQRGLAAAGAALHRPAVAAEAPMAATRAEFSAATTVHQPMSRPAPEGMIRYVVQRYDSPWRIAERHLGDGTRWRELRDEHGRPLAAERSEPDRDPRSPRPTPPTIHPGDIVLLPQVAPATDRPVPPRVQAPSAGAAHREPVPHWSPLDPDAADSPRVASSPVARIPAPPSVTTGPHPSALSRLAGARSGDAPAPPPPVAGPPAHAATTTVPPTSAALSATPIPWLGTVAQSPTLAQAPTVAQRPTVAQTPVAEGPSIDRGGSPAHGTPLARRSPGDTTAATEGAEQPPTILSVAAHRHPNGSVSVSLVEAGLLSAGVLGALHGFRRRQARHRPPGRRIRLPGRLLATTERDLRLGEQPGRADLVERAMHLLVASLQDADMTAPTILAVVAGPTALEILLDRPLPPPAPWTSSAEGFRWRVGAADVCDGESTGSAPLPALAPIGLAGDERADVLVNLEAAGALFVTGEAARAEGVVRGLATGLSAVSWAQAVSLVLVGFGSELEGVERVRSVASLDSVLPELRSTAEVIAKAIGEADPFDARVRHPGGEGWAPTIVCCAPPLAPAERAELLRLATPGTGVVAVMAGPSEPTAWTIDVDCDPMAIQPLRLGVQPTILDARDLDRIGALYRVALDESGATVADPPYNDLEITADRPPRSLAERLAVIDQPAGAAPPATASAPPTSTDQPPDAAGLAMAPSPPASPKQGAAAAGGPSPAGPATPDDEPSQTGRRPPVPASGGSGPIGPVLNGQAGPGAAGSRGPAASPPPILVRVLGTVEIDGASVFKRAKSRELAVYLALHPGGVGEAELDEALWPSDGGRLVASSTRDSTVSVARTALGGPTRLLPAQGYGREKRYQVSGEVGTDWELFCQLHRQGRAHRDAEILCQALELVRARPFEGVIAARTYGWVHTEGHARHIEAEVGDAADLAAGLLLAAGKAVEARWAARRGLLADPYIERLWVRLMEAGDQLGDSQEIERILDEMDAVLDLGGDFSGLHPHTLATYDRLSRRHRLPS